MGRKQTGVSGFGGMASDGPGWARPYRVEWGEVVGHRVRRLRQTRQWALKDLAERVPQPEGGRSRAGYVSRLERGWTSPQLYVYIAVAEAFGVLPGDLLGTEDLDRELTAEQRMLLGIAEELGLAPHEAAVRLVASGR